jgi:hypothetical protein
MTQEIIEMAQECGLIGMRPHLDGIYSEALVAFAKLVTERALADPMREVQRLGQEIEQEPICPSCKAEVLYECVACSSNNYPPQRTEQEPDDIASIIACRNMLDAQPVPPRSTEQNFCPRCGKRTPDLITIHTCTPPKENT